MHFQMATWKLFVYISRHILQTPGISRFYSTEYYCALNRDVAIEIEVFLYTSLNYNNLGNLLGKYKPDRLGGYKLNFAVTQKSVNRSYTFLFIYNSHYTTTYLCITKIKVQFTRSAL